jgi:hypothetical protein
MEKTRFRRRHKNLKNRENFRFQNKVIFSAGYWKTLIKGEKIAKKLKMIACAKIGKLEMVFYYFFVTRLFDLSNVCIC